MLKTEKSIKTLTQLGLTINQAKTYLTLIKLGPSNAKEVSKTSNIAQQDIYRVMPELQKLGLVEKLVASPNLFKASLPDQTLSVLLKRKEKENSILHEETLKLVELLKQDAEIGTNEQNTSQFSIISGKKTIMMRSRKAIKEANESICILTPWKNSAKNTQHFLTISKQALNRQVEIRFIFYLPEKEVEAFLRMMRHLTGDARFKVRLISTDKPVIFSVFDAEQVFFSTRAESLGNAPILWSNNTNFAALAQNYFDMIWELALEIPKSTPEKTTSTLNAS